MESGLQQEFQKKAFRIGLEKLGLIKTRWIQCPVCNNKIRNKIRADTELKNYSLYCPKCKRESLIEAKNFKVTVIKEPDAGPTLF